MTSARVAGPGSGVARYLLPDPAAMRGPGAAGLREWVERLAVRFEAAGFTAPPAGAGRAPEPRFLDPASPPGDEGPLLPRAEWAEAARWVAAAEVTEPERRAALLLLTDVLAVGAAPPVRGLSVPFPAALSPEMRPPGSAARGSCSLGLRASLWRPPADGRRSVPVGEAVLRNRAAGDGRELLVGPECVNAAVAAAEAASRPLRDLLDAIAVGSAVGDWRRRTVGRTMERLGIHAPGALAPVASAAAVSRLLGLGPEATAARLRLAETLTPIHPYGAFAGGAPVKLLYGAWGQFLGLLAAMDGPEAFPRPAAAATEVGNRWPEEPGAAVRRIAYKKYPGSRAVQPVAAAVERLPRFSAADLETVRLLRIEAYPFAAEISGWADPARGPISRQMHLPTAAALALGARSAGRPLSVGDYRPPLGPAAAAPVSRAEVRAREFGADPVTTRVRRARLLVRLGDGREFEAEAGAPFDPPPPEAIRARFRSLTEGTGLRDPRGLPPDAPVSALFAAGAAAARRKTMTAA